MWSGCIKSWLWGAPAGHGGFLKDYKSKKREDVFFNDKKYGFIYVKEWNSKREN